MKNLNYFVILFALLFALTSCQENELQDVDSTSEKNYLSAEDGLITLQSGIVVEKKNGEYFFQGDIRLSEIQLENLNLHGDIIAEKPEYIGGVQDMHPVYNVPFDNVAGERTIPRAFSISPTPYNMWAMVRIIYGTNLTTAQKTKIHSALLEIESQTNVRFYNATCEPLKDPTYGFVYPNIEFWAVGNASASSSYLGRIGGVQRINLADFAFSAWTNSVIIHEIGHALGLRHEHTRIDRNTYVNLNTSNLKPAGLSQFQIPSTNYYQVGTYSYESIMGYSSYTSSTDHVYDIYSPMYTKKDGSTIFQGSSLSDSDRSWLNYFYTPYVARSDTYAELAPVVYKSDNTIMTSSERLSFQASLNGDNPNPPNCCSLTNNLGKFTCP